MHFIEHLSAKLVHIHLQWCKTCRGRWHVWWIMNSLTGAPVSVLQTSCHLMNAERTPITSVFPLSYVSSTKEKILPATTVIQINNHCLESSRKLMSSFHMSEGSCIWCVWVKVLANTHSEVSFCNVYKKQGSIQSKTPKQASPCSHCTYQSLS